MKVLSWPAVKKISCRERGFTMAEVLASLISLGVVVMSAQSVLMASNTFLHQSQDTFEAMESRNHINDYICSYFHAPPFIQQDPTKSFYYKNGKYIQVGGDNNKPATLSYPLLSKSDSSENFSSTGHSAVSTYVNGSNFSTKEHLKKDGTQGDKANNVKLLNSTNKSRSYESKFYDIYANSHTIINLSVQPADNSINTAGRQPNSLGSLEDKKGNIIIASRCIENKVSASAEGQFVEAGQGSILDSTAVDYVEPASLYVLEGLKYRPFHFPDNSGHEKIKCCDIDPSLLGSDDEIQETNCKTLKDYTPVAYVIKISSEKGGTSLFDLMAENKIGTGATSEEAFLHNQYRTDYDDRVTQCDAGTVEKDNDGNCYAGAPGQTDCTGILVSARQAVKTQCMKDAKDQWRHQYYFPKLREKFNFPVTFTEITELPLIKVKNPTLWTVAFSAESKSQEQSQFIDLKLINIENQCKKVGLKRTCPLLKRGSQIEQADASYLNINLRTCPFNYSKAGSEGGTISLGLAG